MRATVRETVGCLATFVCLAGCHESPHRFEEAPPVEPTPVPEVLDLAPKTAYVNLNLPDANAVVAVPAHDISLETVALEGSPFVTGAPGNPDPTTAHSIVTWRDPSEDGRQFLLVANDDSISTFHLDPETGRPELSALGPMKTGGHRTNGLLTVDTQQGALLLAATCDPASLVVFALDPATGTPSSHGLPRFSLSGCPQWVVPLPLSPDRTRVLVATTDSIVFAFEVDRNSGEVTQVPVTRAGDWSKRVHWAPSMPIGEFEGMPYPRDAWPERFNVVYSYSSGGVVVSFDVEGFFIGSEGLKTWCYNAGTFDWMGLPSTTSPRAVGLCTQTSPADSPSLVISRDAIVTGSTWAELPRLDQKASIGPVDTQSYAIADNSAGRSRLQFFWGESLNLSVVDLGPAGVPPLGLAVSPDAADIERLADVSYPD